MRMDLQLIKIFRNYPLIIGLILALLFLSVAIFGSRLAPYDPTLRFTEIIEVNGEMYIPSVRPIAPFILSQFPLGTDSVGRDILSRLLWAVRPTLLTCVGVVTLRLLIGLPLGILAGWYRESWIETIFDSSLAMLVAIPQLILALSLIALSEERALSLFILVLGLIGWPDVAQFYKAQTALIRQKGYIESAFALGASTPYILWRHILPQFWPTLATIIAFEVSATLLIMAELGFLGIYVGNGLIVYGADPNSPNLIAIGLTADLPELAQMLSDFTRKILSAPWEMVMAAFLVFLQVFAFNMLGEGLRRHMNHNRS